MSNPRKLLQPVIPAYLGYVYRLFAIDKHTVRTIGEVARTFALLAPAANQIAVQCAQFHAFAAHDVDDPIDYEEQAAR